MPQWLAGIIFAAVIIYIVAKGIYDVAQANPLEFWFTVGSPVALIAAFCIDMHKQRQARLATLPHDGPMQVDILEDHNRHGRYACGLTIDVKISRKDWEAIRKANLVNFLIFEYPGISGPSGADQTYRDFKVSDLEMKSYVGFLNTTQMHDAKEKLIQTLHQLRAHIDGYREGPQRERFEI